LSLPAIELAPDREPWVRQPRESEKGYVAFQAFLNQKKPRSIVRLAAELPKPVATLYEWSSRNHWYERVAQFDGFVRRSLDAELVEQRIEMNKRHAQLAKAMSAKVAARIQSLQPDELSPGELGRWMQVISMTERLALGEATSIEGSDGTSPGVNVEVNIDQREQEVVFDRGTVAEILGRLAELGVDADAGTGSTAIDVGDASKDEVRPDTD
jgi:hypothetical protein